MVAFGSAIRSPPAPAGARAARPPALASPRYLSRSRRTSPGPGGLNDWSACEPRSPGNLARPLTAPGVGASSVQSDRAMAHGTPLPRRHARPGHHRGPGPQAQRHPSDRTGSEGAIPAGAYGARVAGDGTVSVFLEPGAAIQRALRQPLGPMGRDCRHAERADIAARSANTRAWKAASAQVHPITLRKFSWEKTP